MLHIGCHLSSSKGYAHMAEEALSIGGNTFQFFTRNPRGGQAKAIDPADIAAFLSAAAAHAFAPVMAHAPYTLNPCAEKAYVREFTQNTMADDLKRLEWTPGNYYNFHPGSHVGQGSEIGIAMIADMLNKIIRPEQHTKILLETMSGKGSEVGGKFEELRAIMDRVDHAEMLGVCLDTCHVYDAGYDIVNNLDGVLAEFDQIIGLERLCAVHLNDSKNPFASHKDRHEKIGRGTLGLSLFAEVINHPRLRDLPFYLETPNELDGYREEITLLRSLYRDI